ncbi:MAG: phosphate signaling complex protein PhoU [Chromatiales bacterium]|jgi:phosphate transport system protein
MVVTHKALSKEERAIQSLIEQIAVAVTRAFEQAMDAFMENDLDLADKVIENDLDINEMCRQIEEQSFLSIALRQPVANDLRKLLASIHIAEEYERIGDYAADIARKVHSMKEVPRKGCRDNFQLMTDLCKQMLDQILDIHRSPDVQSAKKVAQMDDNVDDAEKVLVNSLISQMREYPETIENCIHAVSIAHKIERIADRVTNIAERIVFSTSGEVVELG